VQGKAVAPGPYSVWEPLSRVVRAVRGVLLLSVVVQLLMLFVLEQGSWWGLFATAFVWWGLGRVASMVRTVLTLPGVANADQGLAQLKKQLADLAQQKNAGKRK
jgi:predicted MFS family arabinose efflux permease